MNQLGKIVFSTVFGSALALTLAGCDKPTETTNVAPAPENPNGAAAAEQRKANEKVAAENRAINANNGLAANNPINPNNPNSPNTEVKADERMPGDKVGERRADEPAAKGGGPSYQEGSREWARDRMAHVRCDHYKTCGDVAQGKKFDTYESCVIRERASLDKDWKLDECGKIDSPRLDACIAAVHQKKCDTTFDTTPSECGMKKVCIETAKK